MTLLCQKKCLCKKYVLAEKNIFPDESIMRNLRRSFYRLLEKMGGNKDALKAGGRTIDFDESEIPFMKVIIRQLYDRQGLLAQFTDEQSDVSSIDIRNFIQSIIDAESEHGATEDELMNLALFLNNTFFCWPLYSMENCHKLIDFLMINLQIFPSAHQSFYMLRVEHILKKEVALLLAESSLIIADIAESIEKSKSLLHTDDTGSKNYYETDAEIRTQYIQRDKIMLAKIQEDDDLRCYIEKKIGKKAEEIFNYASIDDKK